MRFYRRITTIVGLIAGIAGAPGRVAAQQPDPIYDAVGFHPNRPTFSQFPFETIDMISGNLILSYTDCVLPGNAGFDLAFTRTYNGNSQRW